MKNKKILLTSISPKKIPWIQHILYALNRTNISFDIYASNLKTNTPVRYFVKKMIYLPEIKNHNKLKISNILKKNLIDYVFPLNEIEQIFWNDNKNYFKSKNKIRVLTKNNSSIYRCTDKIKFYKYCKKKCSFSICVL